MRSFCSVVLALVLISSFNSANPEDKAIGIPPSSASPAVTTPAQEVPAAQPEKPAEVSPVKPEEEVLKVLLDDSLPEGALTQGTWEWDTSLKYSAEKSHTQPAEKALAEHSYRSAPVNVPEDCLLEQYVYIDPDKIPAGIMLRFTFEADGKEGEIGIYREGEEEIFVFNDDEAVIYDGTLPEAGKWEKWAIDPNDLGLKGAKITGISFVVYGGKVNWDLTRFVPSPKKTNN